MSRATAKTSLDLSKVCGGIFPARRPLATVIGRRDAVVGTSTTTWAAVGAGPVDMSGHGLCVRTV